MISYEQSIAALERRAIREPQLADAIALHIALLTAQSRVEPKQCVCTTQAEEAATRLQSGLPILQPNEFQADPTGLAVLHYRICILLADHYPELADELDAIRNWFCTELPFISNHVIAFLKEGHAHPDKNTGLNPTLLNFVFKETLHPFLRKYARMLAPFVDVNSWYRAYCPICGGEPDFAALDKESRTRRLLCSRCDMEWAFWRMMCPFCGCDDPDRQQYSHLENPLYSLYRCKRCERELMTVDLQHSDEELLLSVERLLLCSIINRHKEG